MFPGCKQRFYNQDVWSINSCETEMFIVMKMGSPEPEGKTFREQTETTLTDLRQNVFFL